MNKEEITAWRVIYQILKETGYDKLYEEEITCIVNALWKLKNTQNNWNELKEWLVEMINEIKTNDVYDRTEYECTQIATLESTLAKVEEIESRK